MGQILPFLREAVFYPETVAVMADAFDRACVVLSRNGESMPAQEAVAKRIIQHVLYGERDPGRLCAAALAALGLPTTASHPTQAAS